MKVIAASITAVVLLAITATWLSLLPNRITDTSPICTGLCVGGIDEFSTTTDSFIGFYSLIDNFDEERQHHVCPVLLLFPSDRPLFEYLMALVEQGNTVNSLDDNGQLRLTIDFDGLSDDDIREIKAATRTEPVSVHVQKKALGGKGAAGCTSFVAILSAERIAH